MDTGEVDFLTLKLNPIVPSFLVAALSVLSVLSAALCQGELHCCQQMLQFGSQLNWEVGDVDTS